MDNRDKYLHRHMRQRFAIAAAIPVERQISWARNCMSRAALQHRTAFYLMASLWLARCCNQVHATAISGELATARRGAQ